MILQRGITSFFDWDERGLIPEVSFDEFKRIIYAVCNRDGWRVESCSCRNVTPNFHAAIVSNGNERVLVVCNGTYPVYAFAEHLNSESCTLIFRDVPELADRLRDFDGIILAKASDLSRSLTDDDLAPLDKTEANEIRYWNPKTIGEVVYNWFD